MDGGMETMNTQESILKTIEDKREQYIHAALDNLGLCGTNF